MSVVAWDGKSIVADMQVNNYGFKSKASKIKRIQSEGKSYILAWVGLSASGLLMAQWWESGGKAEEFPTVQADKDEWARLIIVDEYTGLVCTYEHLNVAMPQHHEVSFMAWGAGRDFAMGAMHMGASARQAVEIAMEYSADCGLGIEEYIIGR